jgi:hypothetical protein
MRTLPPSAVAPAPAPMMRTNEMIRILSAAALLALAAPLHAQPSARRLPACIVEASASAGTELTRYGCAGAGPDAAVRFSIALPADWEAAWQDTAEIVLTATSGDNALWIVGSDRLPEPRTRPDTVGFWMRATELLLDRDVTAAEVEDFRDAANGRVSGAREWLTHAQLADSTLLALVAQLSTAQDGRPVLSSETEVRMLGGEPAGYLSEVLELGGRRWRFTSYVTVRDAALFMFSFNAIEGEHDALLPLVGRVLASFDPRTERW